MLESQTSHDEEDEDSPSPGDRQGTKMVVRAKEGERGRATGRKGGRKGSREVEKGRATGRERGSEGSREGGPLERREGVREAERQEKDRMKN